MSLEVRLRHRLGDFALEADFSVPRGGVTALFGNSGSGKSTTLKAIAGLIRPDEATIRLGGTGIEGVPPHRRRIGLMFQDSRLFPHLSVRQNLVYGAKRAAEGVDGGLLDHIVGMLGIGSLLDRRPRGLSGGEAQRVALGRTLMTKPRALLLDEPMASLDQPRKEEILPYLQRLPEEADIPILYVSHVLDEVSRLADRMVVLDRGKVAAEGDIVDVLSRLDLFPLTGRFEAGALIDGAIQVHDPTTALSAVAFDGGMIWVPALDAPEGSPVRLRIRARDVLLATRTPDALQADLSANSLLSGTVTGMRADEKGPFLEVQVTCGGTKILSRITRRSAQRLGLAEGSPVTAVVKTATVDRRLASVR
ncbi:MAG: molybdenum ABC transporter ATP-binding protein [Alphaproteobacteria bacterium]|nr:molybdenum ABC transporter ATP-binding protein [Alphaproteobacteria bacterium]